MKRFILTLLVLTMTLTTLLAIGNNFSGGSGTQLDPYQIANIADLIELSEDWHLSHYFIQTADIDASSTSTLNSGAGFLPIGSENYYSFEGSYDGAGFTISNLYINRPTLDGVGLFWYVDGATIKNLGFIDNVIIGKKYTGALVGQAVDSTIINCYATGSVTGLEKVGGLVGGCSNISISNSYSTGSATGTSNNVGGLIGYYVSSEINSCFASGTVSGTAKIGGLIGYAMNSTAISNCYTSASVTGTSDSVGGFAGNFFRSSLDNCYSTGLVTGPDTWGIGGLVGSLSAGVANNSFWDTQTSGQATSGGGIGKTTAEMQTLTTFTDAGWDFVDDWQFVAGDYPHLNWEILAPAVQPSLATLVGPTTELLAPINAQLEWSYDGEPVDGFELVFNGGEVLMLASDVFTYDPGDLAYNTEYEWTVTPYIAPDTKPEDAIETWSFTTTNLYTEDTPELIQGTPVGVQLSAVLTGTIPAGWAPNGPLPIPEPSELNPLDFPLPAVHGAYRFGASISQSVAGSFTYTFTVGAGDFPGEAYLDGELYFAGTWLGGVVTVVIPFTGERDEHEVVITEPTLPVTLSSFTAVSNANEYVSLQWVTESESNLLGYNVYRAESDSFQQAMRINSTVVEAYNQTVTSTYTYTDREVESTTYYYWLEVAELSNENTFHGPIEVRVEDETVVPGISETTFRNFGPSPFTNSTSTSLRVKEGETASITIYNLLGQVVSRESFNAGEHNFIFNGRDLNNKKVANGIYFVKMTSPTTSKSFKIVKIK